ncbi:MAG: hypothetical protein KAH14_08395 [Clostridiales bacterium]|nr:hypothetical protein [Clostridiales bacterium]
MSKHDSFTNQVISFYRKILCNPDDNTDKGLLSVHNFFKTFYSDLCIKSQSIGVPHFNEVLLNDHVHHSKNKDFAKAKNKTIKLIFDIVKMIYDAAVTGEVINEKLYASSILYDKAIKSQKTIKVNIIKYLETIGMSISVSEDNIIIQSVDNATSIKSLVTFAKACCEYKKLGHFYFYICDFNVFDKNYTFDIVSLYKNVLRDEQYQQFLTLHEYMISKNYEYSAKFNNLFSVGIKYTNKIIKASPLLSQTYNFLYKNPFIVSLRFVALSRITPIIHLASLEVQKDFYDNTGKCGNCGWCKNQKGLLRPSLLKVGDKQKTICWYRQKNYYNINLKETSLVIEYVLLHEHLKVS